MQSLNETLEGIHKLGCLFKGLEPCLVDFPFRREGREVYLCWELGENRIGFYHGLEEGYEGRKPLELPRLPKKKN